MKGSGTTTSVWMDTGVADAAAGGFTAGGPAEVTADVAVVGAGIAGVTTAYLLQRSGKRVLLLDDGNPGDGETGRTTAHLSNAIDDRYTEIERVHGTGGARLAADSHTAAIDTIERLAREEGIDCGFARVDGYLMLAPGDDPRVLDEERAAAHRAGLTDVERIDLPPGPVAHPGPCLRFPAQARFHPMAYLAGLVRAFRARGGRLASGARVERVAETGDHVTLSVAGGPTVVADTAVVATNSPISDLFAIHTKQAPYRTYAIALRVARGAVPDALYWDTRDIYHYVRLQPAGDHDLLIVGGEDHKTGEARDMESRWAALEEWTRVHFPAAGAVERRWSGQVMEPYDGLAFIGRDPGGKGRVHVVTGDSGMGMTHGTLAGLLLCELIHGFDHPWAGLYNPSRLMTKSLRGFLEENLDVARQYLRHLAPSDADAEADVAPGQGAVIREGGRPVAVYRDPQGTVHRRSAVCTHLHCIVRWNPAESSWDCPCHGSRFAPDGTVLNGPAAAPLAGVEPR
ncbi:FAD-dependent oxidoreductase [Azospirillum halopraeferens]|uniref:FAD-dependent oxidoreductase n=1 Tax=Azospirillum halopraeferens TaxID=34010 RepID=UPI00040BF5AA|nr:FAD-dependent oxidoreductase [Azospirillum halopraeferens]